MTAFSKPCLFEVLAYILLMGLYSGFRSELNNDDFPRPITSGRISRTKAHRQLLRKNYLDLLLPSINELFRYWLDLRSWEGIPAAPVYKLLKRWTKRNSMCQVGWSRVLAFQPTEQKAAVDHTCPLEILVGPWSILTLNGSCYKAHIRFYRFSANQIPLIRRSSTRAECDYLRRGLAPWPWSIIRRAVRSIATKVIRVY